VHEEKSVDVGVPKAEGGEDVTEDDIKLIKTLKLLGIKPKIDSLSDLQKIAQAFQVEKEPVKEQTPGIASSRQQQTEGTSYHFPKISVFYGESGKGEVSWESWKYEVEALINSRSFTDEQILLCIRRSLKGDAGDRVRSLFTLT